MAQAAPTPYFTRARATNASTTPVSALNFQAMHWKTLGKYGRTPTNGDFFQPFGVCASSDGMNLFVADCGNNCVQVLSLPIGNHMRTISAGVFKYPTFLCLSPDDTLLFVADSGNNCVQVLRTSDYQVVRTIGTAGRDDGQFDYPQGLCVSPSGERLYVVDSENNRLQVFRVSDGAHLRTIWPTSSKAKSTANGGFDWPCGISMSPDGQSLFVADHHNNRIQVFNANNGVFVRAFGCEGRGLCQFACVNGVCLNPTGDLIVIVDDGNNRVQLVRADDGGHVRTFGTLGDDDGQFKRPMCVCWVKTEGDYKLVVTEAGNSRVQLFH